MKISLNIFRIQSADRVEECDECKTNSEPLLLTEIDDMGSSAQICLSCLLPLIKAYKAAAKIFPDKPGQNCHG